MIERVFANKLEVTLVGFRNFHMIEQVFANKFELIKNLH